MKCRAWLGIKRSFYIEIYIYIYKMDKRRNEIKVLYNSDNFPSSCIHFFRLLDKYIHIPKTAHSLMKIVAFFLFFHVKMSKRDGVGWFLLHVFRILRDSKLRFRREPKKD